jgi:hypothetical protein
MHIFWTSSPYNKYISTLWNIPLYLQHWQGLLALILLLLNKSGLFLRQSLLLAVFWLNGSLLLVVLVFFSVDFPFGRVLVLILVVMLSVVLVIVGFLILARVRSVAFVGVRGVRLVVS